MLQTVLFLYHMPLKLLETMFFFVKRLRLCHVYAMLL